MRRLVPAVLLTLALAACGGGDDPTVAADPGGSSAPAGPTSAPAGEDTAPSGAVVLRGNGLVLGGTAYAFGTSTLEQVRPALTAALGPVEEQVLPCPAGQRTALGANGFDVLFDEGGAMVGWDEASGQGVATESGLRLGSTRAEVEAALPDAEFTESTLGPEFSSPGGLGGFLEGTEPSSAVLGLTGGEQCVQR